MTILPLLSTSGLFHKASHCTRSFHTTFRKSVPYHNLVRLRPPSKAALKAVTDLILKTDGIEKPLQTYSAGSSQSSTSYLQFSSIEESLRFVGHVKAGSLDIEEGSVDADTVSAKQTATSSTKVIYVKELPDEGDWDESSLQAFFSRKFGPVTRVVISRHGYQMVRSAYIEFESMEDAAKVIKKQADELFILSGMLLELDYSPVNLARLVSRRGTTSTLDGNSDVSWNQLVHIRSLPKDLSSAQITQMLAERGFTPSAVFACFEQGQNPGYVDVQLETAADAAQLVESFRTNPYQVSMQNAAIRYASAVQGQPVPPVYPHCRTIYLSHMPSKVDEKLLFQFFSRLGTVQGIKTMRRPQQEPFTTSVYIYMARGLDAVNIVRNYEQTPLVLNGTLLHPQFPPPRVTLAIEDRKVRLERFPGSYAEIVETLGQHAAGMEVDAEWKGWIPLPGVWSGRLSFPSPEQAIVAKDTLLDQLKLWIADKQKLRAHRTRDGIEL